MVTDKFIEFGFAILDGILTFLDALPDIPEGVLSVFQYFISFCKGGICALNCFMDLDFIRIIIPIWVVVTYTDRIYHFVMWIIRKIPILSID